MKASNEAEISWFTIQKLRWFFYISFFYLLEWKNLNEFKKIGYG